jgi:hypothetical protein
MSEMHMDNQTKLIIGVIILGVLLVLFQVKTESEVQCMGICGLSGLFLLSTGIFSMRAGLERYRLMQNIRNIPSSKAQSAAVGLAEFHGKAFPMKPMVSPISKEKCAYYYLDAKYYHRLGKSASWFPLFRDMPSEPFYLEDETGRIRVNPSLTRATRPGMDEEEGWPFGKVNLVKVDLKPANTYKGHISETGHQLLVPRFGQKVLDYVNSSSRIKAKFANYEEYTILIREYYIPEGQEIYVMGSVLPIKGAKSSKGHENLVVREAKEGGFFYIGTRSEEDILAKLKFSVILSIAGGLAASALGLLILLWGLGL